MNRTHVINITEPRSSRVIASNRGGRKRNPIFDDTENMQLELILPLAHNGSNRIETFETVSLICTRKGHNIERVQREC